jgi:PAS domain S-box-containing protein
MPRQEYIVPLLVAAILAVSAIFGLAYKSGMDQTQAALVVGAMEQNDLRARQLAGTVAQQAEALFDLYDMALTQLVNERQDDPEHYPAAVQRVMKSIPADSINLIAAADHQGRVIHSSDGSGLGVDISDRDHFRYHATTPNSGLGIGNPVKSRLMGGWAIPVSRAVRQGGRFLGVVIVSVRPDYLSRSLQSPGLGEGDVVGLAKTDGTFLARNRNLEAALGRSAPPDRPFLDPTSSEEQTFRAISSVDGVELDFAWHRMPQLGLIAVVALDESAALAPLRAATASGASRTNLMMMAVVAFALLVASALLWSERQRRQRQKQALRYHALLQTASDGLHVMDQDGNPIQVSEAFAHMLGYTVDEVMRLNLRDWDAMVPREQLIQKLRDLIPRPATFETRHRRKDGTVFDVEVSATGILLDGKPHIYAASRDISSRKAAEIERLSAESSLRAMTARMKLVLDTAAEGIFGIDDEARLSFANRAAVTLLGWPSAEAMHATSSTKALGHILADGESCEHRDCAIRATLVDGQVRRIADEYFTRADGVRLPVEYVVAPLFIADMVVGAVVAFHDISERKALEDELRRSNAELERFAYVASHDLRQPLRMVSSYLGLIEKRMAGRLDEDERTFMDFAINGAKRMDHMITDLLGYSRIGRENAPKQPVALGLVLERAVSNLKISIEDSGAEVVAATPLPEVAGYESELERLLQNLIGNAVKFKAEDRPPLVTITASERPNEWVISVADNGIGIEPADFERLFQVFQRLVSQDRFEGTGIGLAACRKIVEHHGGRIWVESRPGEGSTFLFSLPKG